MEATRGFTAQCEEICQRVARVDALAAVVETFLEGVSWHEFAGDRRRIERLAHLVGAVVEAAEAAVDACDDLPAHPEDQVVWEATPITGPAGRVTAAVAALRAVGAGPLLEALRSAQLEVLQSELGPRATMIAGLMCVDGFCVEPFLDAATAIEIPDYSPTEIVEICLRSGPWARVDVATRRGPDDSSSTS